MKYTCTTTMGAFYRKCTKKTRQGNNGKLVDVPSSARFVRGRESCYVATGVYTCVSVHVLGEMNITIEGHLAA